jgi:hypothetical protein
MTSILQTLYAFPVAGSQAAFIQVPLILVVMACAGDVLIWAKTITPFSARSFQRTAAAIFLFSVPLAYVGTIYKQRKEYNSLPALDLPGAQRVHATASQAQDYHWLAVNIQNDCDVFVGLPELPSLHLWTSSDPPAGLIWDAWILTFTKDQQLAVVSELSRYPRACAIYNPILVAFWNRGHQNIDMLPLVRYIHENFRTAGVRDRYYFLIRKDRDPITLLN